MAYLKAKYVEAINSREWRRCPEDIKERITEYVDSLEAKLEEISRSIPNENHFLGDDPETGEEVLQIDSELLDLIRTITEIVTQAE